METAVNQALTDLVDAQPAAFSGPSNQPIIVNIQQNIVKKIPAPQKPQSAPERFFRPPTPQGYHDMMGRESELHKCRTCEHEVKVQNYKITKPII